MMTMEHYRYSLDTDTVYILDKDIDIVLIYKKCGIDIKCVGVADPRPDTKWMNIDELAQFLLDNPKYLTVVGLPADVLGLHCQDSLCGVRYDIKYHGKNYQFAFDSNKSHCIHPDQLDWPADLWETVSSWLYNKMNF